MSGFFYGLTRAVGAVVGEVVSAPGQIVDGGLDAIDEFLEGE